MDFNARFKRVTDLFVEGEEVYLGDDPATSEPVVIWVNKLNSFEIEEARRDGIVQRGLMMRDLAKEDNPNREAFYAEMRLLDNDALRKAWVNQRVEELYLDVLDEVEGTEEMREKVEMMRRLPTLLADSGAAEDDPRHAQLQELQIEYLEKIREGQEKRQKQALKDAEDFTREDLEASYFEKWRERQTLDLFMEERRITEIYVAARDCAATRKDGGMWDHSKCDHSQKLLPSRASVKEMPAQIVERLINTLDAMTSTQREAGNSGAPESSSASSERSSASEAPSNPSSRTRRSSLPPTS